MADSREMDALKAGALLMYQTLQDVATLHGSEVFEGEEGDVEGCAHCSNIAEAIVHYPCPTMIVVLNDFEQEETPAE